MFDEFVTSPRVSTRFVMQLFGEHQKVSSKEDLMRETIRRDAFFQGRLQKQDDDMSTFDINEFLCEDIEATVNNDIRRVYMSFLTKVSNLTKNSDNGNRFAAKTMYRIIAKAISLADGPVDRGSPAVDQAHRDASSYFGFVAKKAFLQYVEDVEILEKARLSKSKGNSSTNFQLSERYKDLQAAFAVPSPIFSVEEAKFLGLDISVPLISSEETLHQSQVRKWIGCMALVNLIWKQMQKLAICSPRSKFSRTRSSK